MVNNYILDNSKDSAKTCGYLAGGTTLSILLTSFNPILGLVGFVGTGIVTLGKYIKNKFSNHSDFYENISKIETGDNLELTLGKRGKLKTDIPRYLHKQIQNYITVNGITSNDKVVIKKTNDGKYQIGNKCSGDLLSNYTLSIPFEIETPKYFTHSKKTKKKSELNNQSATEQSRREALRRMRHVTPTPRRLGLGGAPGI
jgi:hypothetical protein